MKSKLRPRTFFDIDIGKSPAGRIVFELYDDLCPKTAENFIKLCTGDCGIGESTGKKLHYLNSVFHRVIKGFMIQGGDFSSGDGTGGESVFGGRFADENLSTPHDRPFMLSMANCGPNTNGSQFFITTKPASHLDGKHVVFGHVVSGENLIESIENLPVNSNNRPVVEATISNCGELIPIRKKKAKKQKEKEDSADSSSSKGKKKKKSKKKKHRNKKKTKPMQEEEAEEMYPKCSVRPDEIPEVPKPYFLYRGNLKEQDKNEMKNANDERKEDDGFESSNYVAKEIIGRSGRLIKGRGQLRYYSKSPRDRLDTPPHWKKESHSEKNNNNENNRKVEETDERMKYRQSRSPSPNYKDRQKYRRSQRENVSPAPVSKSREQYEVISREKRKKYEVWKDIHSDDKIKRAKKHEEVKDYGDLEIADRNSDKPNLKEAARKRSPSVEKVKRTNRDKVNVTSDHKAAKSQQQMLPNVQSDKPEEYESGTIIFPYADESDDSLKHRRSEKVMEKVQPVVEQKTKMIINEPVDRKNEIKKPSRNDYHDNSRRNDSYMTSRKRSSSSESKGKSKSPGDVKKRTHSPPAHLVAKWQNRREKIMIRRPSVSRSNDRHHSKPRYSPRKRSSKYSSSSKSDLIVKETKPHNDDHKSSDKNRKIPDSNYRERSSSGTIDSSLSSAGSSVSNRPCRIDSELSDTEKTVNTQCWVNDNTTSNQQATANKETKIDVATIEKPKEVNEINKNTENSIDKETLMVLKGPEKPWVASQWKTEEEEANKRNAKTAMNSVLAKLREDDQKTKSQEKPIKTPAKDSEKKVQSPVSQSISKYRSPSGSKSSGKRPPSSKYSSSSSSASVSRGRSRSRDRSYSRSKVRSRSRSRSRSYRRKYRSSHYHRSYRRSNSRSGRRYRSRSRSYSPIPRRRYSSKSSSSSRSSRYRSRRNYRGLGFRRPSGSPRPRK